MTLLVVGLLIFFSVHSFAMFRGARQRVVDRIGALPYRGLFSVASLVGFVLLVMGYGGAPRVELWAPPLALRYVALALMWPAMVFLAAMYAPGYIKAKIKNPMLIAVKTWALAHLLANGDLASIVLFGAFLVWGVVDLIAVKRSGRSPVVAAPRAVFDVLALVVGTGLYLLIVFYAHVYIAGVALWA
ncbi:MAG: NnrU family protein [Gammaproteobacteria bacterium]